MFRIREYNHAHDPETGEFTSSPAGKGTKITHTGTDWFAHVHPDTNGVGGFKIHLGRPEGKDYKLAGTHADAEGALNLAKDFLTRKAGDKIKVSIDPKTMFGKTGYAVSSTKGHAIFTSTMGKAQQIQTKILQGHDVHQGWLDGLL